MGFVDELAASQHHTFGLEATLVAACMPLTARLCRAGSLPASWSRFNLTRLALDGNAIMGSLPEEWRAGKWAPGVELTMSGNQLSGKLPGSWGNISFAVLSLSDNKLTGLPYVE